MISYDNCPRFRARDPSVGADLGPVGVFGVWGRYARILTLRNHMLCDCDVRDLYDGCPPWASRHPIKLCGQEVLSFSTPGQNEEFGLLA